MPFLETKDVGVHPEIKGPFRYLVALKTGSDIMDQEAEPAFTRRKRKIDKRLSEKVGAEQEQEYQQPGFMLFKNEAKSGQDQAG